MFRILLYSLSIQVLSLSVFSGVGIASELGCSFNTQVITDEFNYDISTQPIVACGKQLLKIAVKRNANPYTQFQAEVDEIVEKAWAEDLDDDGRYELLLVSRKHSDPARRSFQIFYVEGNTLKHLTLPEPGSMSGYRGGDRFVTGGGRVIRSYPRYFSKDIDGEPKGGEQKVVYQFRNKELLLATEPEPLVKMESSVKPAAKSRSSRAVKIQLIEVKQDYIEIKADAAIDNYKIVRISDPWRLIIDIPGAVSEIPEKSVRIDSHGVSKARIGVHKGFLRIVLDSTVSPLPTETVTQIENSLRVSFYKLKDN